MTRIPAVRIAGTGEFYQYWVQLLYSNLQTVYRLNEDVLKGLCFDRVAARSA
jgi:hypothetical protein